tara:strand:- start:1418 stop:1699 length:282 start_codon:yes stop_codon:yes gene_type:complete
MSQYLIKAGEKVLYGFGFGSGMGISFYVLPCTKRNNLQNNYNDNDINNILSKDEFQNMDTKQSKLDNSQHKNDKKKKYIYENPLWGWGWYYKQ